MSYSPALGRFLEMDPAQDIDGPNEYQLEKSSPTDSADPLGLADVGPSTGSTTGPSASPGDDLLRPAQPTTGPGTPTTKPIVQIIVGPHTPYFIVVYNGPGVPIFEQTVTIEVGDGQTVPDNVRNQEVTIEHAGKDPFKGPVGDNNCKDPNNKVYGATQEGGPPKPTNRLIDRPNFKTYPKNFTGVKRLVTTVLDPNGKVIKVIKWHVSDVKGQVGPPTID